MKRQMNLSFSSLYLGSVLQLFRVLDTLATTCFQFPLLREVSCNVDTTAVQAGECLLFSSLYLGKCPATKARKNKAWNLTAFSSLYLGKCPATASKSSGCGPWQTFSSLYLGKCPATLGLYAAGFS